MVSLHYLVRHKIRISDNFEHLNFQKHDFQISQGSAETSFRRGGKYHNSVVTNILLYMNTNNYENRSILTQLSRAICTLAVYSC